MNTAEHISPDPQSTVDKLGLKVSAEFVPFSQSRNRAEKSPSLNWRVTLYTLSPIDGQRRDILTTDYSAGYGHAPSYYARAFAPRTLKDEHRDMRVAWECEHGFPSLGVRFGREPEVYGATNSAKRLQPKATDVIYSLVMDSSVLDAGGFETWAGDLGYDVDSRKAESIYKTCLEIALKLRSALGDAGLSELREAFAEY